MIDSRDKQLETPINIEIKDSGYASIALVGGLKPFTETTNASLKMDVKEFSLPVVSSYVKSSMGFDFEAGQMDSVVDIRIVDSTIDGETSFLMRGVEMTSSGDEPKLLDETAVPMNVALGMLKDKQGNIELKVPLGGDVDDPSFSTRHFLTLIAKKAVMSKTKSYLMHTFVPYASVVSVAMSAADYALKVRFEDLEYQDHVVEIDESQRDYMNQLIALLQSKPKMQVKVCPVSVPAETDGQGQRLVLAENRSKIFKEDLVGEGIESSRLLLCKAQVDNEEGAKPRIKLSV